MKRTLERIENIFATNLYEALRPIRDRETGKDSLRIDIISDEEFSTALNEYDRERYRGKIEVYGEERPGFEPNQDNKVCVLLDALDGSDLAERGLSNWCSAAVFIDHTTEAKKVLAAIVGVPPNHVYYADENDGVHVFRNIADLKGSRDRLILDPEPVKGLPRCRPLSEASLYFYGQKANRFCHFAQSKLVHRLSGSIEEHSNLRLYNLGGIPMLIRMCDHPVNFARGVDAVFELQGQKPHDALAGLFFALKSKAKVFRISTDANEHGSEITFDTLDNLVNASDEKRLGYLVTAHQELANELLPLLEHSPA